MDTQGDAFFIVFPETSDAVRFAAAVQSTFAAHPWPDGAPVLLRIGVHAGRAMRTRTGYVGMDVHYGARVAAAAHGGQVLVSGAVAAALGDVVGVFADETTPPLRSLGSFTLKDIREPVELLQVEVPGLPGDFPPPRTLDEADEPPAAGEPPYPGLARYEEADAERFFGREALVRSLVERLEREPFLAVVGASGSGKSSLVRAGLIPALRRSAPDTAAPEAAPDPGPRAIALLTPTDQPLAALDAALAAAAGQPWAVVVDQLEELFTLCRDDAERASLRRPDARDARLRVHGWSSSCVPTSTTVSPPSTACAPWRPTTRPTWDRSDPTTCARPSRAPRARAAGASRRASWTSSSTTWATSPGRCRCCRTPCARPGSGGAAPS